MEIILVTTPPKCVARSFKNVIRKRLPIDVNWNQKKKKKKKRNYKVFGSWSDCKHIITVKFLARVFPNSTVTLAE